MSRSSGVGGYRGRRTITDILRIIAIVLAVVVVLVLIGLWFGQEYIVYTDDGLRLELPPFLQSLRQERPGENPDPGSIHYTETPDASADGSASSAPEEPPARPVRSVAYELPVRDVTGGTAAARLSQLEDAQALVLEMKGRSGKLAWHSEHKTALWSEVSSPQTASDALKQWNAGEVYTVARVCCFRDDAAPYHNNALALRRGQYNWRDELGLRWLSPAQEDAQAYLAALCGELAALGFDEIVLEDFTFPTRGNLETISRGERYDPSGFTREVESFLAQAAQAVAPYGTVLSLRLEADSLSASSGLTPQLVEQYAGRVWTENPSLLEQAGLTLDGERLVEIVSRPEAEGAAAQAVLLRTSGDPEG